MTWLILEWSLDIYVTAYLGKINLLVLTAAVSKFDFSILKYVAMQHGNSFCLLACLVIN